MISFEWKRKQVLHVFAESRMMKGKSLNLQGHITVLEPGVRVGLTSFHVVSRASNTTTKSFVLYGSCWCAAGFWVRISLFTPRRSDKETGDEYEFQKHFLIVDSSWFLPNPQLFFCYEELKITFSVITWGSNSDLEVTESGLNPVIYLAPRLHPGAGIIP